MPRQLERFPRNTHWFMLRTEQQLAHFNQEPWRSLRHRAFLATHIPGDIDHAAIRAICLEDVFADETEHVDIPEALHTFPNLTYLRLPKRYIPSLRPGDIPTSIRALEVIGTGTATFPAQLSLPHVTQVAGIPTALKFTQRTFPNLGALTLRLDRQRTMLQMLEKLDKLYTLAVSPIRDDTIFTALGAAKLRALYLGTGQLQSLDGIERFQELDEVGVASLDRLEAIDALARLPKLQDIRISWCAQLANFDPLLHIPTLRELTIFGCKRFDQRHYGPLFRALPLTLTGVL